MVTKILYYFSVKNLLYDTDPGSKCQLYYFYMQKTDLFQPTMDKHTGPWLRSSLWHLYPHSAVLII